MSPQDRYTEDGLDTLAAFIDVEEEVALPPLDRSTLEAFANCPASAVIREQKLVIDSSNAANSGNEVHAVMSAAITEWITTQGWMGGEQGAKQVGYLADWIRGQATISRPDVQPDVVEALRGSAWAIAEFLDSLHPGNILRYDGGDELRRSGQLGWNVPHLGRCLTSEVDLLVATAAKDVLDEHDWKSGQKRNWAAAEVRHSFQFGMHAWLIFMNYPEVNVLNVTIWPTRNVSSRVCVQFFRKDIPALEARIMNAANHWAAYHGKPVDVVPCWPSKEKCRLCDGRTLCPIKPPAACADDPAGYVAAMLALSAKLEAMRDEAIEHVEATGADIVTPDGIAFGFSKPIERKPKAALYETVAGSDAPAVTREPKQPKASKSRGRPRSAPAAVNDDAVMDEVFARLNQAQ